MRSMRSVFFVSIIVLYASFNVCCARNLAQRLAMRQSNGEVNSAQVSESGDGLVGSVSNKNANYIFGQRRSEEDIYVPVKYVGKDGENEKVRTPISTPRETPSTHNIGNKRRKVIRCHGTPCSDKTMCRHKGQCGHGHHFCNKNSSWRKECLSEKRAVADKKTGHGCVGKPCPNPNECRDKNGNCGDGLKHCNQNSTWRKEGCNAKRSATRSAARRMAEAEMSDDANSRTSNWDKADGVSAKSEPVRRVEAKESSTVIAKNDDVEESTIDEPVRRTEVKAPSSGSGLRARLAKHDVKGDSEQRSEDKRRRVEHKEKHNQMLNDLHPLDGLSARLAELEAKEALLEQKLTEFEGVRRLLGSVDGSDDSGKDAEEQDDEDADDRKLAFHILQEMKILRRMGRRSH